MRLRAIALVKGNLATGNAVITLRLVTTGKKGAITFLVKIVVKPTTTTSRWTITSGTKAYKGLSGKALSGRTPIIRSSP